MIKIDEDREFLIAQRVTGRRGSMVRINAKFAKKQKEDEKQKQKRARWNRKQRKNVVNLTEKLL